MTSGNSQMEINVILWMDCSREINSIHCFVTAIFKIHVSEFIRRANL